jgi:hypothetical protein
LLDILAIAIRAVIAGADSWKVNVEEGLAALRFASA